MSYSRATWYEGSRVMSGTVRSSWITDNVLFYPNGHAYTAVKENRQPKDNWFKFPLKSVKLSSGEKVFLFLFFGLESKPQTKY